MHYQRPFSQLNASSINSELVSTHVKIKRHSPFKKPMQKMNKKIFRDGTFSIPKGW